MKKFGDFILALGIVAILAVIAESAFEWRMLNDFFFLIFTVGGLALMLFGIIFRNIGKNKNAKNMAYNNPNNPQ